MIGIQHKFLFRTVCLIAAVCASSYLLARMFFHSPADVSIHVMILLSTAVPAAIFAWTLVVHPMAKMIREDAAARQNDFQSRFHEIIDNMQEGVVIWTGEGVTEWNRASLRLLDVNDRQLRRLDPHAPGWKLLTENGIDLQYEDRPTQQCLRSGIPISSVIGLRKPTGELVWLRVHASPVFAKRTSQERLLGSAPKIASVVTTYRDITTEREALQRFELAMKAVRLGVWDMDMTSGRIMWDEALCEMFGVEQPKFKRGYDAFEELIVHEDRERVRRSFELALHECRDASMEFRIRRKDGAIRVVRAESRGFYSRDGRPLRHVGVNWDVTEQREQELKVLQASKMSSLGEMSAGIAHEINNPLAIIIGKAETLRSVMQNEDTPRETLVRHVDTIEKTANRIARIVKSLRAFSRDGQDDPFEQTNIGEIVNEALALCHSRFLNHGIELTVSNFESEAMIDARAVQISQVLLNLLNNAFDAVMPLEEKWVRIEIISHARHIEFSVIDSGKGIPAVVRDKMAQPFFTTKEVGMGTGLGLSIATGIVQAHSGSITVDSACPNTRITVRLPKSQAKSQAKIQADGHDDGQSTVAPSGSAA